jgi:hypothetical protein
MFYKAYNSPTNVMRHAVVVAVVAVAIVAANTEVTVAVVAAAVPLVASDVVQSNH